MPRGRGFESRRARAGLIRALGQLNALRRDLPEEPAARARLHGRALESLHRALGRRPPRLPAADDPTEACDRWLRRLEIALGHPARHLAVYGTLAPGEENHGLLHGIPGTWRDGFVRGTRSPTGWGLTRGFPGLRWQPGGPAIPVKLFSAATLPDHWARLDRFEGKEYCRILVPVESEHGVVLQIANLYAVRADP